MLRRLQQYIRIDITIERSISVIFRRVNKASLAGKVRFGHLSELHRSKHSRSWDQALQSSEEGCPVFSGAESNLVDQEWDQEVGECEERRMERKGAPGLWGALQALLSVWSI